MTALALDCKKSALEGNKGKYLKTCAVGEDKCVGSLVKTDSSTVVLSTTEITRCFGQNAHDSGIDT